jgi:hypothetical protein
MHRSRAISHTPDKHNLNGRKTNTRLDKRAARVVGTFVATRYLPDGDCQDLFDIGFDKEPEEQA